MSIVGRIRSFTVPKGSRFICTPLDGDGPLIVGEGCQVSIRVDESWEVALEAMRGMFDSPKEPSK